MRLVIVAACTAALLQPEYAPWLAVLGLAGAPLVIEWWLRT